MKTAGIWIIRIALGLMGLTLLYSGFMWAFMPADNLIANDIVAQSILGLNMVKSDIGGPLMAVGLMQLLFVFGKQQFLWPLVLISLSYFAVRTTSLIVDGSHPMIIAGIAMELLVPALNLLLHKMRSSH